MHRRPATALAAVLTAALVVSGCTGGDEAGPSESPSPSPSSEESTFEIRPVRGERVVEVASLSTAGLLGLVGEAAAPDQAAIDAAVEEIATFLDDHLDGLQRDGQGVFGRLAASGLRDAGNRRWITRDLTTPDNPVARANYRIFAYHDGAPEWLTVRVRVRRADESVAAASMTFVVREDGSVELTMFGPDRRRGAEL